MSLLLSSVGHTDHPGGRDCPGCEYQEKGRPGSGPSWKAGCHSVDENYNTHSSPKGLCTINLKMKPQDSISWW